MAQDYFDARIPSQTFRKNAITKNDDGSFSVKGVKIFRTGSFRDSQGRMHKVEGSDLDAMVHHFETLTKNGLFTDVPVRKDHSKSVEKVMGYFEKVYRDGDFLVADYGSVSEEDLNKLVTGIFRNVSAEIGVYPGNDEKMYFPTVMGVAYVDIPAVSGLFSQAPAGIQFNFGAHTTSENGDFQFEVEQISQDADAFINQWVVSQPEITYYSRDTQEQTVTKENEQTFTFRIGGEETTDFAKVQAHIAQVESDNEALRTENEQYAADAVEATKTARAEFVKALAEGDKPKIVSGMVENLTKLAQGMDEEAFAEFKATYEAAPSLRQYAEFGNGSNHDGEDPDKAKLEDALLVAREQVATLRRSGMSEDRIKQTASFRKLTELEAAAS